MTADQLRAAAIAGQVVHGSTLVRALWHDARGEWDQAHRLAQDVDTADGARVHAYLHRREGDAGNARYWYHRARRAECSDSLEAEWTSLAEHLLATPPAEP